MKKYIFSIAACVLLLGGLIAYYVFTQAPDNPEDTDPTAETNSLTLLDRESSDVLSFEISRPDEQTTYFLGENGTWAMDSMAAPVDHDLIKDTLTGICTLTAAEKANDALSNPSEYGFEPSAASITVNFFDNTSATVHLGGRTPDKSYYYMMLDGDPALYLIHNALGAQLNRSMGDLLDRSMLYIESADALTYIHIQAEGRQTVEAAAVLNSYDPAIQPTEAYQIYTSSPVSGKILHTSAFEQKVITPLMTITLGALVAEATPANLTAYGFDNPTYDVTLAHHEEVYHLTVGNFFGDTDEAAYAVYEGIPYIFEIDSAPLKTLLLKLTAFDFMDSLVSVHNIDNVSRVTVIGAGDRTYDFELEHTFIKGDGVSVADYDQITPTLNGTLMPERDFRDLYATIILIAYDSTLSDDEFTPEGDPALTITYEMADGTGPYVDTYYDYDVNFYAIDKGELGAFLVGKPYVRTVLDSLGTTKAGL